MFVLVALVAANLLTPPPTPTPNPGHGGAYYPPAIVDCRTNANIVCQQFQPGFKEFNPGNPFSR